MVMPIHVPGTKSNQNPLRFFYYYYNLTD